MADTEQKGSTRVLRKTATGYIAARTDIMTTMMTTSDLDRGITGADHGTMTLLQLLLPALRALGFSNCMVDIDSI